MFEAWAFLLPVSRDFPDLQISLCISWRSARLPGRLAVAKDASGLVQKRPLDMKNLKP